jgi:multisubunit Na+/H+ antiporter MnhE subunit
MRRIVSLVVWWALLFGLWTLYVGTTQWIELVFGLGAAALAAVALKVVRSQGLLRFRLDTQWLARGRRVPQQIVFDFGLVTWELVRALAHRRYVQGELFEADFPAGRTDDPRARWRRAWATTLGTMSPNAIVLEIDAERNAALLHSLRTDVSTGREAL